MRQLEEAEQLAVEQEDFESAANLSSELDSLRSAAHMHTSGMTRWTEEDFYMLQPANKSDRMCHPVAMTMHHAALLLVLSLSWVFQSA